MAHRIFTLLETAQHELWLFSAIFLLLGGLDALCVDAIWIARRVYRRWTFYRITPPLRAHQLPTPSDDGLLAIFVPAWGEAAVIGTMLQHCTRQWHHSPCRHRIYVGCYPNDPKSAAAVINAARSNMHIQLVLVRHDGPTTKADCLNRLWHALLADEIAGEFKAKAIILHDAEDAVHADELHVFNCLVLKGGAVQLPVIPARTAHSLWISGHYCDEFAEAHGKNMVVREALGAPLPLAGVACAIDRNLMARMAMLNDGLPFDPNSLTEDYELGIRIGSVGGRTIMARVLDSDGELVATRACFPDTLTASVRQKTRWLIGIALAGWDRIGWRGKLAQKWMLLQDRKSIFAAVVIVAAYVCIILTAILSGAQLLGAYQPARFPPTLVLLLWLNLALLLWRLAVRASFVAALYGPKEAFISVPRSLISNIIAIMAARRACTAYVRHCLGVPLKWDKTTHHTVPEILAGRD